VADLLIRNIAKVRLMKIILVSLLLMVLSSETLVALPMVQL